MATKFRVNSPRGSYLAGSWAMAVDLLCAEVKTTLLKPLSMVGVVVPPHVETWANEQTWANVRPYAENRESFTITVSGADHGIEVRK
jgi:hypothetical protein